MKKNNLLILLCLISFINNFYKVSAQKIIEEDYITFFNEILKPDTLILDKEIINSNMTVKDFEYFLIKNFGKVNIELNSENLNFIKHQIENGKKIKTNAINRKSIKKSFVKNLYKENKDLNTIWHIIHQIGKGYYELTLPLFNKNKDIAFCSIKYYCGSLCAYNSHLRVYKKVNGKWNYYGDLLPVSKS